MDDGRHGVAAVILVLVIAVPVTSAAAQPAVTSASGGDAGLGRLARVSAPLATSVAEPGTGTQVDPLSSQPARPARLVYRWPSWIPWVIAGIGLGVGLASVPLFVSAANDYARYDRDYDAWCGTSTGCVPDQLPSSIRDLEHRADAKRIAAFTLAGVGGAAVITGLVLVFLNQPRLVTTAVGASPEGRRFAVLPAVLPGGALLTAGLTF